MKKFTLAYTYKVIRDGQTEMCYKPSDESIDDYLATYLVYNNLTEALADVDNCITQLTPIMYDTFESMDNVPLEIRNQFEL